MPVFDHADDIAHPQWLAVGPDYPIVQAMVASGCGFAFAVGLSPQGVVRVQNAAPEARLEPVAQRVAKQVFGMR
ncbi:hypothetical protein D3C85_1888870 [compost metagenome]